MTDGCTPISQIPQLINATKASFLKGTTLPAAFRRQQLWQLYKMIDENQDDIIRAVQSDMHKRHTNEISLTEISGCRSEIAHQINHLAQYMAPKKVPSTAAFFTDSGTLEYTPIGNVLIIAPWNFPVQLTIAPLAGAIAAGCTAIIKPSEVSKNTEQLLATLLTQYLDSSCYKVVTGAANETGALLKHRFDLIFFTGGCSIGKIVARAAAEHLTPCVLELGGKNPVILDDDCDFAMAARRIAWGRWCLNCGQICLAPEYVICSRKSQGKFLEAMNAVLIQFFGDNPQMSEWYSRVINERHFDRLNQVLGQSKALVAIGGQTDRSDRYIAPTVLRDVSLDSAVMRDEVFGPILSVFPVDDVRRDAIPLVQSRDKSLALYVFSNDKNFVDKVVKNTDAGGVTVNDVIGHFMFPGFPFGGSGHSGMGKYHGWYSFEAFSHEKPVLNKYAGGESAYAMRLPPYTEFKGKMFKMFAEEKPKTWQIPFSVNPLAAAALAGGAFFLKSRL